MKHLRLVVTTLIVAGFMVCLVLAACGGASEDPETPPNGGGTAEGVPEQVESGWGPQEDGEMIAAVNGILAGMYAFRAAYGFVPDATMVCDGGAVCDFIAGGWPESPYYGGPIRNVWNTTNDSMPDRLRPGDIIYWSGTGTPNIDYVLGDGEMQTYYWTWQ